MTERINAKIKIVASKKEKFQNLKNNRFTGRFFKNQQEESAITNLQIKPTSDSALITWKSNIVDSFDVLVKGFNLNIAEKIQAKTYQLTNLFQDETYTFSVRPQGGQWIEKIFTARDDNVFVQSKQEENGVNHTFIINESQIVEFTAEDKNEWSFETQIQFDTKQIVNFQYENDDREKWHVEMILNDKIIAKSNKSKIDAKVRIGNLVVKPMRNFSLKSRARPWLGIQATGLLRRNPEEATQVQQDYTQTIPPTKKMILMLIEIHKQFKMIIVNILQQKDNQIIEILLQNQ